MKYPIFAFAVMVLTFSSSAHADEATKAIHKMEKETLEKLYKERPDTQREIKDAAGYAVFTSGELAIVWVSAGYGHGVAHNNKSGDDTYMQMAKAGVGVGVGAKDYNIVLVFHDANSFKTFTTDGLDLSGTADVVVKAGEKGDSLSGAVDILPGVRVYQLTDTGLLAQAMLQGVKFWRDDTLNKK